MGLDHHPPWVLTQRWVLPRGSAQAWSMSVMALPNLASPLTRRLIRQVSCQISFTIYKTKSSRLVVENISGYNSFVLSVPFVVPPYLPFPNYLLVRISDGMCFFMQLKRTCMAW